MNNEEMAKIVAEVIRGAIPQVCQPHEVGWWDWEDADENTPERRVVLMVRLYQKGWGLRLKPETAA